MGIVCFFQADTKVGFSGESAGETAVESKQRIISRSMFSADFQAVCQILIITFGVQIQVFDMAIEDAEKRILIQQIFGRIIGVQIRLSVLEQGVQGIQFLHRYPSRRYRILPADDIFCMRQVPHGCR